MSNSVSARGTMPEGSGSSVPSRNEGEGVGSPSTFPTTQGPVGSPSSLVKGGSLVRPETASSPVWAEITHTSKALGTPGRSDESVEAPLGGLSIQAAIKDDAEDFAGLEAAVGVDEGPVGKDDEKVSSDTWGTPGQKRRYNEDERISDEQASRAGAIKRLRKATTASHGPGLPIQKALDAKEVLRDEKPVDESTLEILEKDHAYRNCPKAITVPCSVMRGRLQRDFGGLISHKGVLDCRLRIDFGRYGRPSFLLILRRSKKLNVPLNMKDTNSFYEVAFRWQPGCMTEGGKYQVEDMEVNSFRKEDEASLVRAGLWNAWSSSEVYSLNDEDRKRLVLLSFTGGYAQIESSVNQGAFQVGLDEGTQQLLDDLYRTHEPQLNVLFLVPGADGRNPRQSSRDSTNFLTNELAWFQLAYAMKLQPDHQYLDKDGNLNITLEMRDIQTFKNRMYPIYSKEVLKCQELEKSQRGTITYWPKPSQFWSHPTQYYFTNVKEYCIPLMVSVVRTWQWENGQHQLLCSHQLTAAVVKSWRPSESKKGKEKVSQLQVTRMNTFFVFVWLPKDQRLRVPAEGSAWRIEFVRQLLGQDYHHPNREKWTGYVRTLTERELNATQASFVLACSKPRGAQWIRSAEDCTSIMPRDRCSIQLSQIVTKGSAENVLSSVREFASMDREDLHPFQMTLAFDREVSQRPSEPLTHGNLGPDPSKKDQCYMDWHTIVQLLRPKLDPGQLDLLSEGFHYLFNGSKIVLGGPGCKKTTTLALATVIMGAVGHKVLVVAQDNAAVNGFHKKLDVANNLIHLLLQQADQTRLAQSVASQSYFRFVAPAIERDALIKGDIEEDLEGMHSAGRVRKDDWCMSLDDAVALAETEASITNDLENDELLDEADKEFEESPSAQVSTDWQILREDYERMAERPSRTYKFPVKHSVGYAIRRLRSRREQGLLLEEGVSALMGCDDARKAVSEGQGNREKAAKNLLVQANVLVAFIVSSSTVVGSTYVSAAHEIMKDSFRPSAVIHEEASRTKLSTVVCGLIFPNVRAHIFIGDTRQLEPFDSASHVNEFSATAKLSILGLLIQKKHGYSWLKINYRNHPDILRFPNAQWYENLLESAPNVHVRLPAHEIWCTSFAEDYDTEVVSQYYFINVSRGISQVKQGGTSLENYANAKAIAVRCQSLIARGAEASSITVAVWYRGQLEVVKHYLDGLGIEGVKVVTTDLYQGEDNDYVILDLTATTQEAAILLVNDETLWQEASSHLTNENRLCMALTRARYGCAIVGSAQSLLEALATKKKGAGLVACIEDAIQRRVMVNDTTEDESDYVQRIFRDSAGYADFMRNSSMRNQFLWMGTYRQQIRAGGIQAHPKQSYGRPDPTRVTYAGPDEGTKLSAFPPQVKKLAEARQNHPDAGAPPDKQNANQAGKRPARKRKPKQSATAENEPGPAVSTAETTAETPGQGNVVTADAGDAGPSQAAESNAAVGNTTEGNAAGDGPASTTAEGGVANSGPAPYRNNHGQNRGNGRGRGTDLYRGRGGANEGGAGRGGHR
jgi:AAA domain